MAKWVESFSVGIKLFDDQHRTLFELVNDLGSILASNNDREELVLVFESLVSYTTNHFAEEERLMADLGYPEYEAHKKEHAQMAAKVLSLREKVVEGHRTAAIEALPIIINWIHNHMSGVDSKYTAFFHSKGVY